MDHLLGEGVTGRALCLVPGGAPEAVDAHPGMATLYIKKRKGFAKMALRHGYGVFVPCSKRFKIVFILIKQYKDTPKKW